LETVELAADDVEPLNETGPWVTLNVKSSKRAKKLIKMGAAYTISGGGLVSFRSIINKWNFINTSGLTQS